MYKDKINIPTYLCTYTLYNLVFNKNIKMKVALVGVYLFVDLQRALATVDQKILVHKLEYYGMCGVCNGWFKSYLSDWKQYVSINGYNSDFMSVNCGQRSVLGPLLFLIYILDLHKAIQHCKVHPFANDTNLFDTNNSVENLNKLVNHEKKWKLNFQISFNNLVIVALVSNLW